MATVGSGCGNYGSDGCCNRRCGSGSRGRIKEFSWNACWCVEDEWKVHPIFLHTDKMERVASNLIFGLSSSLCVWISVRASLLDFFFFSAPASVGYRRLSEPQTWLSTLQPCMVGMNEWKRYLSVYVFSYKLTGDTMSSVQTVDFKVRCDIISESTVSSRNQQINESC